MESGIVLLKKLKLNLLSERFFLLLFIGGVLFCLYRHLEPENSKLDPNVHEWQAVIQRVSDRGDYVQFVFDVGEVISGNYFKEEREVLPNFKAGDVVLLRGKLVLPKKNTVPNLFNYRHYLKTKGQYYVVEIESITFLKETTSWFYQVKNWLFHHLEKYESSGYLKLFLLGDKHDLEEEVIDSYQTNGISHLFAISGMHISLLSAILFWLLRRFHMSMILSTILVMAFILFYMTLVDFTPSVARSVVFFCLLSLKKLFRLKTSTVSIFLGMIGLLLFFRPLIIYDVGFQYSASISFFLILYRKHLKQNSYFRNLLVISTVAFLLGLPISLYHFYQVNLLGIVLNLFFVPFVSFVVFPLTLLTFCFPFLDSVYLFFTNIMETISLYFVRFDCLNFVFGRPSLFWIFLYYLFLLFYLFSGKRKFAILTVVLSMIFYFQLILFPRQFFIFIDVGQGDATLFHSAGKTMLIDTGGKLFSSSSLASDTLVPLLHSLGIRSLNYLILTHGDYDHMGEGITLVESFKVGKVIFNSGKYNDLELALIQVLNEKNIPYYQNIQELRMGNQSFYFLNRQLYDDENDNSMVLYTELHGIKLLFMGDAGVEVEEDLLEKYNFRDIELLKVGHHGSKTSSSEEFIHKINPRYSIISVGKNNWYHHPNEEILNRLKNSVIYRTDQDGSVMVKIENDHLYIETYAP